MVDCRNVSNGFCFVWPTKVKGILKLYPPWNKHISWKWMVGRWNSFWDDLFSGAMLVSGRVYLVATIIHPTKYIEDQRTFLGHKMGSRCWLSGGVPWLGRGAPAHRTTWGEPGPFFFWDGGMGCWDGGMVGSWDGWVTSEIHFFHFEGKLYVKNILKHHPGSVSVQKNSTNKTPKNLFDTLFFWGGCKRNKQIQKNSPCYSAQFSPTKKVPKTW